MQEKEIQQEKAEIREKMTETDKKNNTDKRTEKSEKPKKKKKIIIIALAVVIVVAILIGVYLIGSNHTRYETAMLPGELLSNEDIELTVISAEPIADIPGYELDDTYVYIAVLYEVHNISAEAITWEEYPYLSIMEYTFENGYYLPVEDSEAEFNFNALQSYSIQQGIDYSGILDGLQPDETRVDADIVVIPAAQYDNSKYFITFDTIDAIVKIS